MSLGPACSPTSCNVAAWEGTHPFQTATHGLSPLLLARCVQTLPVPPITAGGAAAGGGPGNPYSCAVLAGQRRMEERRAALAAFKAGEVRFLVATDVAARGIDIQVKWVGRERGKGHPAHMVSPALDPATVRIAEPALFVQRDGSSMLHIRVAAP